MSLASSRTQLILTPWLAVALAATAAHAQAGTGARYGARDARKCHVPSPGGAPSPAQAALAFVCRDEGVGATNAALTLDDVARVEVGRARAYQHGTDSYQDIDVRRPLYPIRGSFVRYLCTRRDWVLTGQDPNRNCDAYAMAEAEGVCYTTTFGDLWCGLSGTGASDVRRNVAPPRS